VAPRGDLDIERRNTAVVQSFRWRLQLTHRWRGKSRLPFLRVRVRVSELNPLLLIDARLRSKVTASAHGVPTPLTQKGDTLGGSDAIVILRGLRSN
jgi:hypothetical protein